MILLQCRKERGRSNSCGRAAGSYAALDSAAGWEQPLGFGLGEWGDLEGEERAFFAKRNWTSGLFAVWGWRVFDLAVRVEGGWLLWRYGFAALGW